MKVTEIKAFRYPDAGRDIVRVGLDSTDPKVALSITEPQDPEGAGRHVDTYLTPKQARRLAKALLRTAEAAEA